jgi:type VI secretion system secreted protein VgrG
MGDASPLARVRLEQQQVVRRMVRGESGCARFLPGSTFVLEEHGRDAFNRGYLITRIEHDGGQPQMGEAATGGTSTYHNKFVCIPDDVPFRAPSNTRRPTIKGIQTAIVVGPAGEEIHTDEHGRVKVQFHWDRQGKRDARSSCWIRVSQIWAGPAWGAMYIPRIGHEVVVDFLEGDPDRPLVVGRVYHGANVPPYPLPANKTMSTMKSNSSSGGDGFNEFRFEDKKGQEEIYLHGQKNWTIRILNDKDENVGHDENLRVEHDREITVGQDQTSAIGRDNVSTAGRDASTSVARDAGYQVGRNQTISVAVNQTEMVGADKSTQIGGKRDEAIGGDTSLNVGGSKNETIGENIEERVAAHKNVTVDGTQTVAVGGNESIAVGKNAEETVQGTKTVTVGDTVIIECGDSKVVLKKDGTITIEGKDITVNGSGQVIIQGGKSVDVKSDGPVNVQAASSVVVKGSSVALN